MDPTHLLRGDDPNNTWCGDGNLGMRTGSIDEASCPACLSKVAEQGDSARRRMAELGALIKAVPPRFVAPSSSPDWFRELSIAVDLDTEEAKAVGWEGLIHAVKNEGHVAKLRAQAIDDLLERKSEMENEVSSLETEIAAAWVAAGDERVDGETLADLITRLRGDVAMLLDKIEPGELVEPPPGWEEPHRAQATPEYRGRSGNDVLAPGPNLSSQRMLDDAARALGWRTDFACGDSPITWEMVLAEIGKLRSDLYPSPTKAQARLAQLRASAETSVEVGPIEVIAPAADPEEVARRVASKLATSGSVDAPVVLIEDLQARKLRQRSRGGRLGGPITLDDVFPGAGFPPIELKPARAYMRVDAGETGGDARPAEAAGLAPQRDRAILEERVAIAAATAIASLSPPMTRDGMDAMAARVQAELSGYPTGPVRIDADIDHPGAVLVGVGDIRIRISTADARWRGGPVMQAIDAMADVERTAGAGTATADAAVIDASASASKSLLGQVCAALCLNPADVGDWKALLRAANRIALASHDRDQAEEDAEASSTIITRRDKRIAELEASLRESEQPQPGPSMARQLSEALGQAPGSATWEMMLCMVDQLRCSGLPLGSLAGIDGLRLRDINRMMLYAENARLRVGIKSALEESGPGAIADRLRSLLTDVAATPVAEFEPGPLEVADLRRQLAKALEDVARANGELRRASAEYGGDKRVAELDAELARMRGLVDRERRMVDRERRILANNRVCAFARALRIREVPDIERWYKEADPLSDESLARLAACRPARTMRPIDQPGRTSPLSDLELEDADGASDDRPATMVRIITELRRHRRAAQASAQASIETVQVEGGTEIAIVPPRRIGALVYKSTTRPGWIIKAMVETVDVESGGIGSFAQETETSAEPTTREVAAAISGLLAHEVAEMLGIDPHKEG